MSEVRRYDIDENGVCTHQLDGAFVSYEDYARLQAEVERLTKQTDYERMYRETIALLKKHNL